MVPSLQGPCMKIGAAQMEAVLLTEGPFLRFFSCRDVGEPCYGPESLMVLMFIFKTQGPGPKMKVLRWTRHSISSGALCFLQHAPIKLPTRFTSSPLWIKKFFKVLCVWYFVCIFVCVPCVCLMPTDARRGHQNLQN